MFAWRDRWTNTAHIAVRGVQRERDCAISYLMWSQRLNPRVIRAGLGNVPQVVRVDGSTLLVGATVKAGKQWRSGAFPCPVGSPPFAQNVQLQAVIIEVPDVQGANFRSP
jgi:hypothetical protein